MKIKRFFSVLLAVILAVGAFALPANAISAVKDTSKDVNLTIYALEAEDGSEVSVDATVTGEQVTITDKKAIEGISFNLYKVADDETSVEIPSDVTPITTDKSDSTGMVKVVIPADAQGRYLVVENEKPYYCQGTTIPFLVDLPMTNPDGTGFVYDVFTYPKQIVTGSVMLTKTFAGAAPKNGEVATFTLTDAFGNESEHTTDPTTGILYINDLSFGEYTIQETDVTYGYDLCDKKIAFFIDESGYLIYDKGTYTYVGAVADLGTIDNPISYYPNITKRVSGDGGKTYLDMANIDVYNGNVATWKISVTVPSLIEKCKYFEIEDILDERLIAPKASEVKAYFGNKQLGSDKYTVTVNGRKIIIEFDTGKMSQYAGKSIDVVFSTPIDVTKKNAIGEEIPNMATLSYEVLPDDGGFDTDSNSDIGSSAVSIHTPTVKVWTGAIEGFKHDNDNKPLSGAEFTLYSDKACKNAVATAKSDKNGKFSFVGLKDGTYWLAETKAPDGYQKNDKILEVKISKDTNNSVVKVDVLNIKTPKLPQTGGMGTLGISILGIGVLALGTAFVYLAVKTYRKLDRA